MNKAIRLTAPFSVELTEAADPQPGPENILLKVNYIGLCGTDLSTYRGKMPLVTYPRIPGHEIVGTIVETGASVPRLFRIGDTVTVNPYSACGQCAACRQKRFNTCRFNQTLGVQRDGALQQYIAVPFDKVYRSNLLAAKHLVLTEPLSVAWHAVERAGVKASDTVLVMGCGMIGTGVILGCLLKGARVIAMDAKQEKLDMVRPLGPIETLLSPGEAVPSILSHYTQDFGPDVVFETAGAKHTYEQALDYAAFGGRVVAVGYAPAPVVWDTAWIVRKELNILGSRNALQEFSSVIEMMEKKSFDADRLISTIYPFSQSAEALAYWHNHPEKVMKILIEVH